MQTLKDGRSEIYLEVQGKIKVEGKRLKKDKAGFIRVRINIGHIVWLLCITYL
ncbi:hypothetical protein MMC2321_01125 [Chitinophaga sp. MM2321]